MAKENRKKKTALSGYDVRSRATPGRSKRDAAGEPFHLPVGGGKGKA